MRNFIPTSQIKKGIAGLPSKIKEKIYFTDNPALISLRLQMRDLLYRNLTSNDRKRRVIASSEVSVKDGLRSVIHRHFVCIVREINGNDAGRPAPYLYVLKERNSKEKQEKFFCRLKGSILAVYKGKLLLILFMHSLKISLEEVPVSQC